MASVDGGWPASNLDHPHLRVNPPPPISSKQTSPPSQQIYNISLLNPPLNSANPLLYPTIISAHNLPLNKNTATEQQHQYNTLPAMGDIYQQPNSSRNGTGSSSGESPTTTSPLLNKQGKHKSDRNAATADDSVDFIDKGNSPEAEDLEEEAPPDYYNLVYLILLLHGIGVLLPWNTFLTIAYDYYIGTDGKLNGTSRSSEYRKNFFNYMTLFAQIPNLALSLLNLFVVIKGGLNRRIYFALTVVAAICLITIAFVFVDTNSWPFGFFLFTMVTIVVLNSANGIYQNSIWGLVADFPGRFTNAIVVGNNLCGILMALLYILIILFDPNIRLSASVFFGLALLTVMACFASFHFLPKIAFYKFYVHRAAKARLIQGTDILHEEEDVDAVDQDGHQKEAQAVETLKQGAQQHSHSHPSLATYLACLKEAWQGLFCIWVVFFTTLAIFPVVLLSIELYPNKRQFDIFLYNNDIDLSKKLYRQLSIFLNFNLLATVGSSLANLVQWPSPKYLVYPALTRLLFIPIFWACNYNLFKHKCCFFSIVKTGNDDRQIVLIKSEWSVFILISLLAVTHGYWSSLAMMYAPKRVDQSKSQIVGMMSGFFLVLGIASGIFFTFAEPHIVDMFGCLAKVAGL